MNQAALEWIHTGEENLIGKKVENVFPTDIAEMMKNMLPRLEAEKTSQIVRSVARHDQNVIPLRMIGIHPPDQDVLHFFIVPVTGKDEVAEIQNEEEMRYRQIYENTGTAICMFGNDGVITRCNKTFEELVGFSREGIEGFKHLSDFIVPEDYLRLSGYHRQRTDMKGNPPKEYEFKIYNRSGEIRHLHMKINFDPETMMRVASLVDITKWVLAEQELRAQKDIYEQIIQQLPVGVLVKDVEDDFRFVVWNRPMEKITGLTADETLGKRDYDIVAQADLAESFHQDDMEVIEKRSFLEIDEEYVDTGRRKCWVHTKKIPMFDETGKTRYIMGILEDITLKKISEEMMRVKDAAIASSPIGVVISDMNGTVTYANDAAVAQYGLESPMKLIGRNIGDVLGKENNSEVIQNKIIQDGLWNGEIVLRNASREKKIISLSASLVRNREGKPISMIGIGNDITERKNEVDEQLRMQKLESLGVLAGGIAHDFNNLLLIMQGNIELAMINLAETSPEFENLDETIQAIRRAKSLTTQLLTFSKGGSPKLESISLDSLVKESAYSVLQGSKSVCEFEHSQNLRNVVVDKDQLGQVIRNIVQNASQAMPDGGTVQIKADNVTRNRREIEGPDAPEGVRDYVHLAITDHGKGILAENFNRIFDPYFTTREAGHGLGLAIAHSIIRKHKGKILVQSEEGKSTTFDVYLPASEAEVKDNASTMFAEIHRVRRILAVDDQKEICDMLKRLGKHLGCQIDTALSGSEAIGLFKTAQGNEKPYDILMLDLIIPGEKGGVEILQELRRIDPEIKAIATTGYSEIRMVGDLKKAGFADVVMKPYNVEKLNRVLEKLMNPSFEDNQS